MTSLIMALVAGLAVGFVDLRATGIQATLLPHCGRGVRTPFAFMQGRHAHACSANA